MVMAGIVCLHALNLGLPIPFVVVLALLAAVGIGLVNGALIAFGRLNPFIVTLGTNFLFTGIAYVVTDGNSQLISNESFAKIGQSALPGTDPGVRRRSWSAPSPSAFFLAPGDALRHARVRRRRRRRRGPALGRAGRQVKIRLYVLSALSAGLAGVVQASAGGSVAPYAASSSNDLLTILAAVIIGGTALTGGRGTIVGTLVGILLLGTIANGLVLKNISSFYQPVVTGAILLIAIVLDETRRRLQPTDDRPSATALRRDARHQQALRHGARACTRSTSTSARARSSRSSATTAPASRR